MGKVKDIQRALEMHQKGKLSKEYYGPNGELYPSVILKGVDPKKAHKVDKAKDREKKEKIYEEYKKGGKTLDRKSQILNRWK